MHLHSALLVLAGSASAARPALPRRTLVPERTFLLLCWVGWSVCAIWSSLFTIGNYLYGRMFYAGILLGVFLVSSTLLVWVVNRLWTASPCISQPSSSQ